MTEIHHELKIRAPRKDVFDAVSTVEGLRSWHAADVDGTGDVGAEWVIDYGNGPLFRWEVVTSRPEEVVEWACLEGPGDSAGTTATFALSDTSDGRTLVEHVHSGWPDAQGNFRKCNTYWAVLLHHLSRFLETGEPATPFDA